MFYALMDKYDLDEAIFHDILYRNKFESKEEMERWLKAWGIEDTESYLKAVVEYDPDFFKFYEDD